MSNKVTQQVEDMFGGSPWMKLAAKYNYGPYAKGGPLAQDDKDKDKDKDEKKEELDENGIPWL